MAFKCIQALKKDTSGSNQVVDIRPILALIASLKTAAPVQAEISVHDYDAAVIFGKSNGIIADATADANGFLDPYNYPCMAETVKLVDIEPGTTHVAFIAEDIGKITIAFGFNERI